LDAALDLVRRLQGQEETLADRWHLDKVDAAIADDRFFLASESSIPLTEVER
jgi:hypothetical protein